MTITNKNKGFTLIELMITVAIVGILASLALPSYQDYVIRGQVSEGFELAGGLQVAQAEHYANVGSFTDLSGLNINAPSGKYVSNIIIPNATTGALQINYGTANSNTKINGGYVLLTPVDDGNGNIKWSCVPDGTIVVQKYVPSSCTPINGVNNNNNNNATATLS